MDQESWTFLFKRWSDDYASSQRLQGELASLKQAVRRWCFSLLLKFDLLSLQYDSLLGQFQALQREREELQARSSSNRHPHPENGQSGMARCPEYQSMSQMVRPVNNHIHPNRWDTCLTTLYI